MTQSTVHVPIGKVVGLSEAAVRQRVQRAYQLPRYAQRFAAGGEDAQARARAQQVVG